MNAKRVKRLRKHALQFAVQNNLPYVDYNFKSYRKVATALDGKIIPYSVYTAFLAPSQKKVYRDLKKEFKGS